MLKILYISLLSIIGTELSFAQIYVEKVGIDLLN